MTEERRCITVVIEATREAAKNLAWRLDEEIIPGARVVGIARGDALSPHTENSRYEQGSGYVRLSPEDYPLIAAAPELLDACRKVDEWLMQPWSEKDAEGEAVHPAFRDALKLVRAVIRKATGAP